MPRVSFVVSLDLPLGVTRARMKDYIEGEVKANVGSLPPEDPLFDLDREKVTVHHMHVIYGRGKRVKKPK